MCSSINTYQPVVNSLQGLKLSVYANNYDPTHTTTLRNQFTAEMNRKFKALIKIIKEAIITNDVFDLQDNPITIQATSAPKQFNFPTVDAKVNAFMNWLRGQVQEGVLTTVTMQQVGGAMNEAWSNLYIKDAYQRGVLRARAEMRAAGMEIPSIEETGGITASLSAPFHADRLAAVYTRAYSELKGITDAMDKQISSILAQGLADGDGANTIASKLVAIIEGGGAELGITDALGRFIPALQRARTLARTEIIRAYHLGNIQEMENWAVEGVKVKAEWSTAGDNRVCDQCANMEGEVYTLEAIRYMIPLHPNCRCVALPYISKK